MLAVFLALLLSFGPAQQSQSKQAEDRSYKKWIDQEVVYIITPDELAVFRALTSDDERQQFVEQFWARRDTDSATSINEFKEEHYRRIAYVNDHFSTGMPGWKSDRGRVYIIQGPPDSVEGHGAGETYYRPRSEGGGNTTTFAFEIWNYRHLEGIGSNIDVEFVDKSMSGHYTLAMDEMEKDMLTNVPSLGLTWSEERKGGDKSERLGTRYFASETARRAADAMRTISMDQAPFQRLQRLAKLQRPPAIKYKDLEHIVSTQVHYNQLPFQLRIDSIKATETDYLVPVTFYFDRALLGYRRSGPILGAQLNVYGRIENMNRATVYAFDDDVNAYFNDEEMKSGGKRSVYQRNVPLKPGRYKLTAVIKDSVSGKLGTLERGIVVGGDSGVILADRIFPTTEGEFITDPFVLGTVKVYPNASNTFSRGNLLGFYFEIYNAAVDAQTSIPHVDVSLQLWRDGKEVQTPFRDLRDRIHTYGDRLFVASLMNTDPLEPGSYKLQFQIRDRINNKEISRSANFVLK